MRRHRRMPPCGTSPSASEVAERAAFAAAASPDAPSETLKTLYPALRRARSRNRAGLAERGDVPRHRHARRLSRHARAVAAAERRPLDRGEGVTIADTADLTGTIVGRRVRGRRRRRARDCILADGVLVPPGRQLSRVAVVPRGLSAGGRGEGRRRSVDRAARRLQIEFPAMSADLDQRVAAYLDLRGLTPEVQRTVLLTGDAPIAAMCACSCAASPRSC
jgi:hypothetical protein